MGGDQLASPELSLFGRKRERNVLNATCVHVYLEATNYWLQLGCMDGWIDIWMRIGRGTVVRIHPLRKWDAKILKLFGIRTAGPSIDPGSTPYLLRSTNQKPVILFGTAGNL